jgi:hypothetical protein
MAKANQADQFKISLFPMFNILICTLGVLIFILGALTTLALGVGQSVSVAVAEGLDGTYTIHEKVPRYIVWDGSSLVANPGNESAHFAEDIRGIETFEETYVYMDKVINESSLADLIHDIRESNGRNYVVLLVRPSGFDSLYEVRGYLESKEILLGYEPIGQGWSVQIPE